MTKEIDSKDFLKVVHKDPEKAIYKTVDFLNIRAGNHKMYLMKVFDKHSLVPFEFIWVKQIDDVNYQVLNIPATDTIGLNDLVRVEHDQVEDGICYFIERTKQVSGAGWAMLNDTDDAAKLNEFILNHDISARQHGPGYVKMNWEIERQEIIVESFRRTFPTEQ